MDNYPTVEGVIIDVRHNIGGNLSDLPIVLGKFVDEEKMLFYTRQKNGPGRLDYTPWTPEVLKPTERSRDLDVPIVVMADMNSISMAEMTTLAVLGLPKGCFIGERTHGGTGTIAADNIAFDQFYGGYFNINDILEVYTTMTMMKDLDGVNHEGVGISPTIEAPFDGVNLLQGIDTQLERAVEYIHTGK